MSQFSSVEVLVVLLLLLGAGLILFLWGRRPPPNLVRRGLISVEDVFRHLYPPAPGDGHMLQRRALQRMHHSLVRASRIRLVPEAFEVAISPQDWEAMGDGVRAFETGLEKELRRHATMYRWQCPPQVFIRCAVRQDLLVGEPAVTVIDAATATAPPPTPTPKPTPTDATVVQPRPIAPTDVTVAMHPVGPPEDAPVLSGPEGTWTLRPDTLIGRAEHCTITLRHGQISREHCRISRDEYGWFITDLSSQNGTRCNGDQVNGSQRLGGGDTLVLGRVITLRFELPGPLSDATTAKSPR